jgi:hypothetical protein
MWAVRDPLANRILLTAAWWNQHIAREHPIMNGKIGWLLETVRDPERIYRSKHDPRTLLYFRRWPRISRGPLMVMVAAGIRPRKRRGYVKTAFLVDSFAKGGMLLWQKPSRTRTTLDPTS